MKYIITVVLTALVVGFGVVAYFKGWLPMITFNKPQAVSVQNTEVSSNNITASTPAPQAFTSVIAGGILVFKAYSVDVPVSWQYSKDGSTPGQIDKLRLTNGDYKIVFTQAAMGGGVCIYPGDTDQGMSIKFNAFNEVTTATGEMLRVGVLPSGGRAVCEIQNSTWGDLTEFGHIDITNPAAPDQKYLDQINTILSSIKKIAPAVSDNQTIIDAVKSQLTNGTNLTVSITKVEGDYAKGMASEQGGGGIWFAAKVNGNWKLVWSGNGVIYCSDIAAYPAFPKDLIPDCWDTSTNKDVTR